MNFNKEELLTKLSNAPLCDGEDFYEEMNDELMDCIGDNFDFFREYDLHNGATKAVIVPRHEDFVIKIPYNGYYDTYYNDYDEEEDYFIPFEGGDEEQQPWNYCEAELKKYNFAKQFGFEKYLAKVEFLGYINGYPIYVQEKCKIGVSHHYSQEERQKTSNLSKKFIGINLNWLTDFRIYYGEEELINFISFISKNHWNDLYGDNVGYLNDKPVLVDFAGYNN